jgi:type II secretory pathway pseudopilin PulG
MAVVVIIAVLATLATAGFRKYVLSSRSVEAVHMIGSIKTAQESYRDETFTYLNVTQGTLNADTSLYPQGELPTRGRKWAWDSPHHPDRARWFRLGIQSDEPVMFGYTCKAGSGAVDVTTGTEKAMNWPSSTGPWYVVRATADHDPGGKKAIFIGSNFTAEIYSENEDD